MSGSGCRCKISRTWRKHVYPQSVWYLTANHSQRDSRTCYRSNAPRKSRQTTRRGRKDITETDATVENDLLGLVEDSSQGDPESLLKWTNKSLRTLATDLTTHHPLITPTTPLHTPTPNAYPLHRTTPTTAATPPHHPPPP